MAIVAEGDRGRVYLPGTSIDEDVARSAAANPVVDEARLSFLSNSTPTRAMITGGVCSAYGLKTHGDLFTSRQIVALTTLSDLVELARERVMKDAISSNPSAGDSGGIKSSTYADSIAVYLALGVSRQTNRSATLNFWDSKGENVQQVFGRQAFAMTWDFVETNLFSKSTGNFTGQFQYLCRVLTSTIPARPMGVVQQMDAQNQRMSADKVISTDPPYFDNINYADLSDFFYVWLRQSLKSQVSDLFATVVAPKAEELVAIAYRHGGRAQAEAFFLEGMTRAMRQLADQAHPAFPVAIYYAFKQAETKGGGTASTGWETFLDAVIQSGFGISGTWPVRTEYTGNLTRIIHEEVVVLN
ncbi:MAG: DUF1156 domain-containing protein [bacterium]|nr:DUF1156 domain-containing protein [bacterium]